MIEFIITIGLIVLVIVFFIKSSKKAKLKKQELANQALQEAQTYLQKAEENKALPIIQSSILLDAGENAYLEEPVRLMETKTIRKNVGSGGRVRIAKGISIGTWSGQSESHQVWRNIDDGILILTNKKLFFKGKTENRTLPLKKIVDIDKFTDGIQVSSDSRSKSSVFTVNNSHIWNFAIEFAKNS